MVTTTATMPMMMPSVVSAPRALLARSDAIATRTDSRIWTAELMARPPASAGLHPLVGVLVLGRSLADRDRRAVLQVLGDRPIAAGDDLVAGLEPVDDLDELVALDAGLDLVSDGLAAFHGEDHLDEPVLVGLVALLRVLALLALHRELVHRPDRDALDRHAERAVLGLGGDLGAGGHARPERLGRVDDRDLDLELGLLIG